MKLSLWILTGVIGFILIFGIYMKMLGASDVTIDVEKNGYCKIVYGNDWKNIRYSNICVDKKHYENKNEFTENQFREVCPKNKLISTNFQSDCFHKSGGIV